MGKNLNWQFWFAIIAALSSYFYAMQNIQHNFSRIEARLAVIEYRLSVGRGFEAGAPQAWLNKKAGQ